MKKIVLAMTTAAVVSAAHAGSMGPVSMSSYTPYLTGEASYTWPQLSSPINSNVFASSSQGWGGRLGAGMMYNYTEKLGFTGEIGGGYYGSRKQTTSLPNGLASGTGNVSFDGYDVLAGFVYKWTYFDVFLQGGFMMENMRSNGTTDLAQSIPGGFYSGVVSRNENQTQTLPEIKVGGIYNINPNWGVDVAYLHVFGSTPSYSGSILATTAGYTENSNSNHQNSTLDAVMFGLHYNFVM